jgi:hypothetical protein
MLRNELLKEIMAVPSPILSVYLNMRSENTARHPRAGACEVWLEKQVAAISRGLSRHDTKEIMKQLQRVKEFLHDRHPKEKALAIFAGPLSWIAVPLQVGIENEVAWGQPSIIQLFWLLHEHHPYGLVVVDHHAARFFAYRLGQLTELATKEFAVDTSVWKEKKLGHQASSGSQNMRGPYPDRFEHRMEAQYARLCRETADQAVSLSKQYGLIHVFVAGPDRLIDIVQKHFAPAATLVRQDLGNFSSAELLERLEPIIAEYGQNRQLESVNQLLGSDVADIANVDETLAQLQSADVRSIVVSKNLEFDMRHCETCGLASRAADPVCAVCGGTRTPASFHKLLPALAMSNNTDIEVVSGEAAQKLNQTGGMSGRPRQTEIAAVR